MGNTKQSIVSLREDANKKCIFLVVGPLRGGGGPPSALSKKTLFYQRKKATKKI